MKNLTNVLKKSCMLVLALFLLSSCYDIVFVSQDKDTLKNKNITPKVCVHVSNYYYPAIPYFGVLLPNTWTIKSGFEYSHEYNGSLKILGKIKYSEDLSYKMNMIDPAPPGYHWWVGFGDNKIDVTGVVCTSPVIKTGNNIGKYKIDYMIGDDINGLNNIRSGIKSIRILDNWTPRKLTSKLNGQSVMLKWCKPGGNFYIKGYNIYRNGIQLNTSLLKMNHYVDNKPATNSYVYKVTAVKANGNESEYSVPKKVCYCPSGPSIQFNGNDNKAIIFDSPSLNPSSFLTLESWVRFKEVDSQQSYIISKSGDVTGFELFTKGTGNIRSVVFKIEPGSIKTNTVLEDEIWYHIAATYDGKMMKLYVNGKLESELYASGNLGISKEPVLIGKRNINSVDTYKGNIDEVRIWDIARTANQIEKYQRLLLDGDEEGLVGYWKMDDGCNYFGCDNTGNGNTAYLMEKTCWCSSTFPFIPDFKEDKTGITLPIINHYFPDETVETITLSIKYNPNILAFKGLDLYDTQMKNMSINIFNSATGYLTIVAKTNGIISKYTDNLIKLNFGALQPELVTVVDLTRAMFNGIPIRTMSGIVTTCLPSKDMAIGFDEKSSMEKDMSITIFPNPVKANATFIYDLDKEAYVELSVYNLTGQKVSTVVSEQQNAGNQRAGFDARNLTPGVYMYVLQANNSKFTGKMIIKD